MNIRRYIFLMIAIPFVTGCNHEGNSYPFPDSSYKVIPCDDVMENHPTWSVDDTDETLRDAALFIATVESFCSH